MLSNSCLDNSVEFEISREPFTIIYTATFPNGDGHRTKFYNTLLQVTQHFNEYAHECREFIKHYDTIIERKVVGDCDSLYRITLHAHVAFR